MATLTPNPFRMAMRLSALLAILSLVAGIYAGSNTWGFVRQAKPVEGKVVAYTPLQEGVRRPIVRFETSEGARVRFTAESQSADTLALPVGSVVEVLYLPQNPQQARINAWWQIWQAPMMIMLLGATPFALVWVIYVIYQQTTRAKQA